MILPKTLNSVAKVYVIKLHILFILLSVASIANGQKTCRLEGMVFDRTNGTRVEDAVVIIGTELQKTTDPEGRFECVLAPGTYEVRTRHLSYDETRLTLNLRKDTVVRLALSSTSHQLGETVVTNTHARKGVEGLSGGRIDLNLGQLKGLPKFMGTNDPLKILQLMPGVQTAGEGNAGIFIRGCEPGHNLILWNEAPIYNPSHMLGLFSVFNTGHIGSFKLHKSNIPAGRGGRLSSLMEVESPDDIPEKTTIAGDVGLISSQISLAIPLNRTSALYLSGRKTYVGLTLKPFIQKVISNKDEEMPFDYEFQDYNLTYVNRPSAKDKIILNAYWGMDKLGIEDRDYVLKGNMKWWNLASSLSWEHGWETNLSMKNTFFVSQYQNRLDMTQNTLSATLPSHIRDVGFRNKFTFPAGRLYFEAGFEYIYHTIVPQTPGMAVGTLDLSHSGTQTYHTHEAAIHAGLRLRLLPRLVLEPGIRYALHFQTGPYDDLTYDAQGNVVDSTHWGRGQIAGVNHSPEPRINLRYTPDANTVVQLSYNRHRQYISLVSISGVGLPTDFWVPASKNIPAQSSDNFSLGYFRSLSGNDYELSVETYYRRMTNQMEYKSMLFDLFNQQYILEKNINYGKGKAYGVEFMFKKNTGRLSGWLSYTLGTSKRYFPDIMNGRGFPAKHDRKHDLSLVANYLLNHRWDFSTIFVYATGNAFTMPQGIHMMGGNIVKEYGKYNGARMPAYHRLDISANYWFVKKKGRESGLNFSIYNLYKHSNPLYIFVVAKPSKQGNNQIVIKEKKKKLYDIIPSISWTFKF